MSINIISGPFKGKEAVIVAETKSNAPRLCGGPANKHSFSVLVRGMLYPIEFNVSELAKIEK